MSKFPVILSFIMIFSLFLISCDEENKKGSVSISMTDAPSDDENVESVFITVTEVKLDGEVWSGFSGPMSIDIMAYQQGNTKALGISEVEAKNYTSISLTLDYQTDAQGNSPGCYVLTTDGAKHQLDESGNTTGTITSNTSFIVSESTESNIVLDFDIRKAVTRNTSNSSNNAFKFVTAAELSAAVRIVDEDKSSRIKGSCSEDGLFSSDKIIVYAYKKDNFDSSIETSGQGSSNILFANATTSAEVDAQGNYTLAFIEEGNYEIHCASYSVSATGEVSFEGLIDISSLGSILTSNISVTAGADVSLNISALGLL